MLDLLFELDQARWNGKYKPQLRLYARAVVLIIDEFLLNPTTQEQQGDILELFELRYDSHTTIIASQFTPDGWHKNLGEGAIADAILDRIVYHSYKGRQINENAKKGLIKMSLWSNL